MKKLLFLLPIVIFLTACSPKIPEGRIEQKQETIPQLTTSEQVLVAFGKRVGIKKDGITETLFPWRTDDDEVLLAGYENIQVKYLGDIHELTQRFFKNWDMDQNNIADGVSGFSYGYTKDGIACVVDVNANKEVIDEKNNGIASVDTSAGYAIHIACGELPEDSWDYAGFRIKNPEFRADASDPDWSITINNNTLVYDSPKFFEERGKVFDVKMYAQEGETFVFKGKNENERISGTFVRQECVSSGSNQKHGYVVEMEYQGEKFTACGDNDGILQEDTGNVENPGVEENSQQNSEIQAEALSLGDIDIGDEAAGLKLATKTMQENMNGCSYYIGFTFSGGTEQNKEREGIIAGYFDEMNEKNTFTFTDANPETLKISYPSNDDTEYLWSASIDNDEILDEIADKKLKQEILGGKNISVKVVVGEYWYRGCQQSEKITGIKIKKIKKIN